MSPPSTPLHARLVITGRLLLLLSAVAAFSVAWGWIGSQASAPMNSGEYVCPMHPEVRAEGPSVCPICRMELELVQKAPAPLPEIQSFDLVRKRSFGQDIIAPSWVGPDGDVTAAIYRDELASLGDDSSATFELGWDGRGSVDIKRTGAPIEPWDRSTVHVHFSGLPGKSSPSPNTAGWVKIKGQHRDLLVVPSASILEGEGGPYVLVAAGDHKSLEKRPISLGRVVGGLAFVMSGIASQERVVVRNTFLFDAERRLHPNARTEGLP